MRLQQLLVDGAKGVFCRLGTSIRSLIQNQDSATVIFADGSAQTYDLVVGADGISSTVRTLMMGAISPAYTGAMAWRSVASIRPLGLVDLQFHLGDDCFFGLCPVAEGRTYGFGNTTEPRSREPTVGRLQRLCRRFAGFGESVQNI